MGAAQRHRLRQRWRFRQQLFTYSGSHGAGSYSTEPQQDADLIVSTSGGAMIEVQVISHGSGNPDPMAVINSFRLGQ